MIFFADTNFFLECKLPQNLNWQDITNDKEIYLYICYPVIQEIDKHKNNPLFQMVWRAKILIFLRGLCFESKARMFPLSLKMRCRVFSSFHQILPRRGFQTTTELARMSLRPMFQLLHLVAMK